MSAQPEGVFQPLADDDPTVVGTYRIAAKLGAGGMGKVYLSYTPAGRPVAVKVIRPEFAEDPAFRRRFAQEVQAARRVHGLSTAPVVDSDTDGSRPWLATAYVQGPTLAAAVADHGPLPLTTVLLLIAGTAEALQSVHAAGLVHRDLKPSNVLLASDGPRVIDFGIARAADATALTDSGVTVGTPAFMSPEQAAGREITPATDVFALGQVAAYAVLGSPAYGDGPSHAVLYRIVHEEPDLSGLPDELRPLVTRCLAKDPADRPSLSEVVTMCQAASDRTQLVRPEQWLPERLAAQIPERHALPGHPPTALAQSTPPPVPPSGAPGTPPPPPSAQPFAHQPTRAASTPPPVAPSTPPPTPASQPFAHQPTQAAPQVGGPGTGGHRTGPQMGTGMGTGAPTPPPMASGPGYPGAPGRPIGPGGPGMRPTGYGYPTPHPGYGPRPYPPRPLPPKKKSQAPVIIAAVVGGFILLSIAGAVLNALGKGNNDSGSGSASSSSSGGSGSSSSGSSHGGGAPKAESHPGVQLPNGYHLEFADSTLHPHEDNYDDFYFMCDFMGCGFGAYNTKLVLLDPGEKGSLSTCVNDTRYTEDIKLEQVSSGSQICAFTEAGTVALLTYKGGSGDDDASRYTKWDVTLWRNAVSAEND